MNDTYIKTYRKCLENPIFNEKPFDRWHAFEYLLLRAQRFPTDIIIKGQTVHLEAGQLLESEEKMAEKWGWSRGKVRRFVELLVSRGVISKNGTALGTVLTIEKYTFYQCGEPTDDTSSGTTDGTTDGTSDGTHKKKVKESKRKIKNNISENVPPELVPVLEEFAEHRKKLKAPLTDHSLELLVKKANKLAGGNTQTMISIFEQSMERGWKGVFAPDKEKKEKPRNEVLAILESGVLDD